MSDHPLTAPAPHANRTAWANAFKALKPKERAFVTAYLKDRNAVRAYLAANPGVKRDSAEARAYTALASVGINAALVSYDEMMAAKVEISKERWLREVAALAFSDWRHFEVDADGRMGLRDGLPEDFGRALNMKVKVTRSGGETTVSTEYALADKAKALALAGKHLGYLKENGAEVRGNPYTLKLEDFLKARQDLIDQGFLPPPPRPQPKPLKGDDLIEGDVSATRPV